jgi:DNA-binding MarR family transcriptional regulator
MGIPHQSAEPPTPSGAGMTALPNIMNELPPLAPSVRTVLQALYEQHPLTGAQIRDRTGLPRRTVYAALQRLKEIHILHERVSLRDTRQTYFWLDLAGAMTATSPEQASAHAAA